MSDLLWLHLPLALALAFWGFSQGRGRTRAGGDSPGDGEGRSGPERRPVPLAPGAFFELGAGPFRSWTRLLLPAPFPLPISGPARLGPRSYRHGRRGTPLDRAAFSDLVWSGPGGAEAGARLPAEAVVALRDLYGWRDLYALRATLAPEGLEVTLPGARPEPRDLPFLEERARALAAAVARLAETAHPGIRFGALAEATPACPVCCGAVLADSVACATCGARHHLDCLAFLGRCGRYACARRAAPVAA